MSNFESSMDAALLNGAVGKRAGLIQGRNEGAAIGYHAGWDDGLAEGHQQATHAAQAQLDAMQGQVDALQAELANLRAENKRIRVKWQSDQEFAAGLAIVVSAAQSALATATTAQRLEFLTRYGALSRQMRDHGAITCSPDLSPRFVADMPSTIAFIRRQLDVAKAPAMAASSTPSP